MAHHLQMAMVTGQLDMGASCRHCPHKWLLHDYVEYTNPKGGVYDAGATEHASHGEGNLHVQTNDPNVYKAMLVHYAPTITGVFILAATHATWNKDWYFSYIIESDHNTATSVLCF